jgi:hypothetical protein
LPFAQKKHKKNTKKYATPSGFDKQDVQNWAIIISRLWGLKQSILTPKGWNDYRK